MVPVTGYCKCSCYFFSGFLPLPFPSFTLLTCFTLVLIVSAAVMANVMGAGKATAKSLRKVLADKTNATSVEGLLPSKSPKKGATAVAEIKEEARTPCRKMRSVEQLPGTPVLRGEDLLRSLVHSNLSIIQTPIGLSRQSPLAETPQFGVPLSPYQDKHDEPEAVVEVSTPSKQVRIYVLPLLTCLQLRTKGGYLTNICNVCVYTAVLLGLSVLCGHCSQAMVFPYDIESHLC
jgi:hypothetical protein